MPDKKAKKGSAEFRRSIDLAPYQPELEKFSKERDWSLSKAAAKILKHALITEREILDRVK